MDEEAVKVDAKLVAALVHMRLGEDLDEFRTPPRLRGAPVPVWCCLACASLYEDQKAEVPIHDDPLPAHEKCECRDPQLIDARSIKFDRAVRACAACGAIWEDEARSRRLRDGIALASPCPCTALVHANARERGLDYRPPEGQPGAPLIIVRAVHL